MKDSLEPQIKVMKEYVVLWRARALQVEALIKTLQEDPPLGFDLTKMFMNEKANANVRVPNDPTFPANPQNSVELWHECLEPVKKYFLVREAGALCEIKDMEEEVGFPRWTIGKVLKGNPALFELLMVSKRRHKYRLRNHPKSPPPTT